MFAKARTHWALFVPLLLVLLITSAAAQAPPVPDPDPAWARLAAKGIVSPTQAAHQALASPAIPDWSRITFQRFVDGQWDVYVGDSTATTPVVATPGDDRFPALDRGGQRLAYTSARNGSTVDLYLSDSDGRNEQLLSGDQIFTAFPDWSPDGRTIVYQAFVQGQYDIFTIDLLTRERRRLTVHRAFDGEPRWSPDGERLLFTSDRGDGVYYLYLMNADGSEQRRFNAAPYSLHPSWSADGQHVGYDADTDGDGWQELGVMNATGGGERTVYDPGSEATVFAGSWSPDGRYLGFTEISVEFRNGNWIWVTGRLRQWDSITNRVSDVLGSSQDWYLNWQTLDVLPPETTLQPLAPYTRAGNLDLTWLARDRGGSGVRSYDLYTRASADQPWSLILEQTEATTTTVAGQPGQAAGYLAVARDKAWNKESVRETRAQQTVFYQTAIYGTLTDNRGAPLNGVTLALAPDPIEPLRSDWDGTFRGYTVQPRDHLLQNSEINFLPLPPTTVSGDRDFRRGFYLLPADSLLVNGQFEVPGGDVPPGWQHSGDIPVRVRGIAASGAAALRMGPATTGASGTAVLWQTVTVPLPMRAPTLAFLARGLGDQAGDGTRLQVVISTAAGVQAAAIYDLTTAWGLQWLDMTPWRGETVSVRFVLRQEADTPPLTVWLDDASLGSTGSDLWVDMATVPALAQPGQRVQLQLRYGNRGTQPSGPTTITLALPPAVQLLESNPPGNGAGGNWRWQFPTMPPDAAEQITAVIAVQTTQAFGDMPLQTNISGSLYEGLISNNEAALILSRGSQVFLPLAQVPAGS